MHIKYIFIMSFSHKSVVTLNVLSHLQLVQYCGEQFYLEVKYDGEHFLIHRGEAGQMRYFSRAQNDFTDTIAPNLNHRIDSFFADGLKNCILDVELLLWDTIDECYGMPDFACLYQTTDIFQCPFFMNIYDEVVGHV